MKSNSNKPHAPMKIHNQTSHDTTNILRPEECPAYNKIVQRKYEEDFWRLYEDEEQFRLEQERLLNDDD